MKIQFKIITVIAIFLFSIKGLVAQDQLNDYKYVIVPEQFACQKRANSYQLNGLTKFLLEKRNFKAILTADEFPGDLAANNCLALFADVIENNNMFKTKLKVVFKDCKNQVIFTTQEGVSKDKDFKVSYNKALRNAIKTLGNYQYNYTKKKSEPEVVSEVKPKQEMVKPERDRLPIEAKPAPKTIDKNIEVKSQPKLSKLDVLKAELITGTVFSYLLKNSKDETVYTILFSGKEDLYMVKGQDAMIYKMNNNWVIAEYSGNDLKVSTLDIKF